MTVRESTLTPLPILACAPGDVVVFDARPSTILSMRDLGNGFVTFTYQPQFCIPRSTTLPTDTDLLVVNAMTPRRWTTQLRFPDGTMLDLDPPSRSLDNYEGDLLSAAITSAVRQTSELLGDDSPDGFCIYVFKTTRARGTEYDRCVALSREHGRLIGRR